MLTEVKCVGSRRSRRRVCGPRNSGNNATTMGNRRIALKVTAIAASIGGAPVPSEEIRITCPGAAQTSIDDSASHHDEKPIIMGERAHADIGAGEHQEEH